MLFDNKLNTKKEEENTLPSMDTSVPSTPCLISEDSQSAIDCDLWQQNLDLLKQKNDNKLLKLNKLKPNLRQDVLMMPIFEKLKTALNEIANEQDNDKSGKKMSITFLLSQN